VADDRQPFRETILRGTLAKPGSREAVALVGILYEYRIVLSRTPGRSRPLHEAALHLDPLEPQAAAELVARVYGMDEDRLFLAFHRQWTAMRGTPMVLGLVAGMESHPYVDRLEPWAATP
jgi:hypothetical protein